MKVLQYYRLPTFGGAGNPTFKKLNQTGGTTLPAPARANDDWTGEESLDIEWAHVMAPMANIILFEANDDNEGNNSLIFTRRSRPPRTLQEWWRVDELGLDGILRRANQ